MESLLLLADIESLVREESPTVLLDCTSCTDGVMLLACAIVRVLVATAVGVDTCISVPLLAPNITML